MKNIKIVLLVSLLFACGPKHLQKFVMPSESPCIDGTLINVNENGCKSFFWGVRSETVKLRCTMSEEQNWWVNTSFYIMPKNSNDSISENWNTFCEDKTFKIYNGPTLLRVGLDMNVESSGLNFRGSEHIIKKGQIIEK
jgi:hypothetical protein